MKLQFFLHVDAENWEWYTQDLKFVEHQGI